MKIINNGILVILVLTIGQNAEAQGFVNLDFESANVSGYSGGQSNIPVANAIPGWTAYISGVPQAAMFYNSVPLAVAAVSLIGTNNNFGGFSYPAIQKKYFVMLWGEQGGGTYTNSAAIGQTGQIPLSAQSLTFWGSIGGMQALFNGQPLTFLTVSNTANYNIYAADISAYAGQVGQLLFTDPSFSGIQGGPAMIDNIQFSSSPVPEPGALSLLALGGLAGLLANKQQRQRG